MSNDASTGPIEDHAWESARTVWASCGVNFPDTITEEQAHRLTDLKRAAASISGAKSVTEADRSRDWSTDQMADQCRELRDALSQIDDLTFSRIVRATALSLPDLVNETMSNLDLLESVLRNTSAPTLPRKKKQEHNDFLVVVLAKLYERGTGLKASVTTDWMTNKREGAFVDFVMSFAKHFLPQQAPDLNARAIQRALKARRDDPEHPARA